ncbi:hypothetical protein [Bradyrhizobium sp. LHD-71]|uniref:hypothetical protein n=1 Tax=Bradyrhizobium sp. LHD-71 TaxID=3072141 RepID=UPI00280E9CD2|nr:hypothetical protein [Bradyrhizobium sp. LHD-71]MDQ8729437.1 hypothetical protein [Bradyrhizobium sp. LHD-71]
MARIRTIKPEFWSSEQVMNCEPLARLLFIGLWNFADDLGHIPKSLRTIKAQVFPGDAIEPAEIERLLAQLVQNALLVEYVAEGRAYLAVTGWKKHQKIDRPSARYPVPSTEPSTDLQRALAEPSLAEGKGEEGSLVETKGSETDAGARELRLIADLQAGIARAFAAANAPGVPDTSRAAMWISQGYEASIILAVVTELLQRKPSISSLNYFDPAIREAHASRTPRRIEVGPEPPKDWDKQVQRFKRGLPWTTRIWGPEPGLGGCQVPREILERYGYITPKKPENAG